MLYTRLLTYQKVWNMNFLFVEDEIELLELYEMLLEDMNIDFTLAKNGAEALELITSKHFDVVFSDIRMPKMDGFQLLDNIVSNKLDIKKFIFITAHVDISKEEATNKGASDILYKPLGHKVLKEYIRKLMSV